MNEYNVNKKREVIEESRFVKIVSVSGRRLAHSFYVENVVGVFRRKKLLSIENILLNWKTIYIQSSNIWICRYETVCCGEVVYFVL